MNKDIKAVIRCAQCGACIANGWELEARGADGEARYFHEKCLGASFVKFMVGNTPHLPAKIELDDDGREKRSP